ncbi:uncharacterized protein METZ01_LOCUS391970 [marine metagenome]|uniref:Uncharacterized protein n=1 Tax=marine metagenome TaxID=408172 RepID=A0A382UXX2_9ZZZZ
MYCSLKIISVALEFSLSNCLNDTGRVGVDQSIKSVETQLQNWAAMYMNYSDIESHHRIKEVQDVRINDISMLLEKSKYSVIEDLQGIFDFMNVEVQNGVLIPRVRNYLDSKLVNLKINFLDFNDFVEAFRSCKEEIKCFENILTDTEIDTNWISTWLLENSPTIQKKQLQSFLTKNL